MADRGRARGVRPQARSGRASIGTWPENSAMKENTRSLVSISSAERPRIGVARRNGWGCMKSSDRRRQVTAIRRKLPQRAPTTPRRRRGRKRPREEMNADQTTDDELEMRCLLSLPVDRRTGIDLSEASTLRQRSRTSGGSLEGWRRRSPRGRAATASRRSRWHATAGRVNGAPRRRVAAAELRRRARRSGGCRGSPRPGSRPRRRSGTALRDGCV